MRITSTKAGALRCRVKVEHEGDVRSIGYHFMANSIQLSLYSSDRTVKVSITNDEMEKIIRQYEDYKRQYPEHFKQENP